MPSATGTIVRRALAGFVTRNWRAALWVAIILGMLLLAPADTTRFIYTEF